MSDFDYDTLVTKLTAAFGRKPPAGGDDDDELTERRYDRGRLQREIDLRKTAQRRADDLGAEFEAFKTGTAAMLADLKATTADTVGGLQRRHSENLTLSETLDGAGRTAVRSHWDGLAKEGRGKNPAEWWTGQLSAHALHGEDAEANPAVDLPRTLSGYLPQAEQPQGPAPRSRREPSAPDRRPAKKAGLPDYDPTGGVQGWIQALQTAELGEG